MQNSIDLIKNELRLASGQGFPVELVAVTKTVPASRINPVYDMGIHTIGENRVQELLDKLPELDPRFSVHMIGQLQTNKVKYIINHVSMIQSVDRISLAREIDMRAGKAGRRMDILLQVNIGEEEQKGGVPPNRLLQLAEECAKLEHIHVRGLMAVPPFTDDPEDERPYHHAMFSLFTDMKDAVAGVDMEILSCGMSGDYLVAVSEGANMVRIGSAIFGGRG